MAANTMFTFENPRFQNFPFPADVIKYMIHKPSSSEGIQKLYQTCKYFFSVNKILVLEDGQFGYREWPSQSCTNEKRFEETKFNAKFWFINWLQILDADFLRLVPLINSHTYLCNITYLRICGQVIMEDEFDNLIKDSNLSKFSLAANCSIIKESRNYLSFDKILAKLPHLQRFHYESNNKERMEIITNETLENLNNLMFHRKFKEFELEHIQISSTADINLLFAFIKKVAASRSSFDFALRFENRVHRKKIQKAANKMLKDWGKRNVNVVFRNFFP